MEELLHDRVSALSLEQKVRLLTGADFWSLYAEPEIGLRRIVMSDGPAGVRGENWDEREPSANIPSPTALAATWDVEALERIGRLLAFECRRKGVDVLLAPTVNLHRSPFGGRHFECFSEDPWLTAAIGAAYVRGLQASGVAACVKHFVANDSETERFTLDARVSERVLRELYLLPFELMVAEGPWSVMAAYNRVNGISMTESPLLQDVLKDEWSWDGVVVSDWGALRETVGAGVAGSDVAMPGPTGPWGDELVAAVRAGAVPEAAVDDKVLRLLRLAERVGALDTPPAPPAAGILNDVEGRSASGGGVLDAGLTARTWSDEEIASDLRATAAASFVLARNHGSLLPLSGGSLRRVALIGPGAAVARTLGGGSATVFPTHTVSLLDGLRAALPNTELSFAEGVRPHTKLPVAEVSAEVRFLGADGSVLSEEHRETGEYTWLGTLNPAVAVIEVRTSVRAQVAGEYVVGASGPGRFELFLRDALAFDETLALRPDADPGEALFAPPQHGVRITLAEGEELPIVLRRHVPPDSPMVTFALNLETPFGDPDAELDRAAALAREADAVIVVVGTTPEVESEGFDRTSLALPGRQDDLVRAITDANPKTVVIVNAGAPVLLPWVTQAPAVLLSWFPGQEAGHALADVILGVAEPGGRLPTTWPASEVGLPSVTPVDGVLEYAEGLKVGYRGGVEPLFPFGHGLGYTSWEYLAIDGPSVRVANTGTRRGREIVQLYASRPDSAIERPARWLVGFAVVDADPGEDVIVDVPLSPRAFQHWDGGWQTEPGAFVLEAGRSVADLRLRTEVTP